jgi:hypothetical protein
MAMFPTGIDWGRILAATGQGLMQAGTPGGNFGAGLMQGAQFYDATQDRKRARSLEELRIDLLRQEQEAQRAANTKAAEQQRVTMDYINSLPPEQQGFAMAFPDQAAELIRKQQFPEAPEVKLTDDQREYQMAVDQGYTGNFFQYLTDIKKAGAQNVTTTIHNKDYGTIPPGFRLREGQDGVYMEAVPGSPAATEAAAASKKKEGLKAAQAQSADIVTQDIGRAIEKIESSPGWTTGFVGNALKGIGGTEAGNVRALLDTVEANTAFDRLQEMRNASPTGGALGSITERELSLLAATRGALQQSQDGKQLVFNLKRLNNVILDIVHGEGQGPQRYDLGAGGASDLKSKYGLE